MKNKFLTWLLVFAMVVIIFVAGGCGNKDMFDTVYTYDYGIVRLANGEIVEGKVEKWTDYEDGDQLQITIDGKTYLSHASDCTLIAD